MNRRVLQIATIAFLAILATACATAITVSSHAAPGLNLTSYRTFGWGPADALPTGDPRLDQSPFFKDHVQGAVEKQLGRRGFELRPAGTPDLLIHYHANIATRINVNRVDLEYGYCTRDDCPTDVVEYEAGTLVLDIIDARSSRLLWRGWSQNSVKDMLDDQDLMAKTIDEAVTRMLSRLPPGF